MENSKKNLEKKVNNDIIASDVKIKDKRLGHRKRLREKYLNNELSNISSHDLLEMLLAYALPRVDTNEIAKEMLKKFKTIERVFQIESMEELKDIKGVGPNTLMFLKIIREITSKMYLSDIKGEKFVVDSLDKLVRYARLNYGNKAIEEFHVIYLRTDATIIEDVTESVGTIDKSAIYPRNIASRALKLNAKSVILIHNHPSGSTNPSSSDKHITNHLIEMLNLFEIRVIEHLIISNENHFSFVQNGLIR